MAFKQQNFFSHSSENWGSEIRLPAWPGEGRLLGCQFLVVFLTWNKGLRSSVRPLFLRALTPILRTSPSWTSHVPNVPPPNVITVRIWVLTYEIGRGHKHSDHSTDQMSSYVWDRPWPLIYDTNLPSLQPQLWHSQPPLPCLFFQ